MSLLNTVMTLDRVVRTLCDELGVDYTAAANGKVEDTQASLVSPTKSRRQRRVMGSRKWTKEATDSLIAMYLKREMTAEEIGQALGRTSKAVTSRCYLLKRQGKLPE